jgi:hypothetical protein
METVERNGARARVDPARRVGEGRTVAQHLPADRSGKASGHCSLKE